MIYVIVFKIIYLIGFKIIYLINISNKYKNIYDSIWNNISNKYKSVLIGSTLYNNPPHLSTFRNPPLIIGVYRNSDFVTN